jgi:arginine/lysine/ornithine decarboxylase
MTLTSLTDEMHKFKKEHRMCEILQEAFSVLPIPAMNYADAYRALVRGDVEHTPISKAGNRIVATGIVPYPPGIPILAPGERTGNLNGPLLQYLKSLQDFVDRRRRLIRKARDLETVLGFSRIQARLRPAAGIN